MSAKQNNSADISYEQSCEDFDDNVESKRLKKESSSTSKALNIGKTILDPYIGNGLALVGMIGTNAYLIKRLEKLKKMISKTNGIDKAEEAMKELLSRVDKYKNLSYNEKVSGFLEEVRKIINEYKSNNDTKELVKIRRQESELDLLWRKSEKEIWHNSFRLIKNKIAVCRDYTYVFGKMARKLKIRCYLIFMFNKNKTEGHVVLLLAKESNNNMVWYVLDRVNYDYFKNTKKSDDKGLLQLETLLNDPYFLEYTKVFIAPNMKGPDPLLLTFADWFIKKLDKNDYQKMKEGYDLCFNKKTKNWEYKKPEPLKGCGLK